MLSGCFGGRFDSEDIGAVASEAFFNIIADLAWRIRPWRVYKPIETILGESVSPFRHRRRIAALIGGDLPDCLGAVSAHVRELCLVPFVLDEL